MSDCGGDAEVATTSVGSALEVALNNNSSQTFKLAYAPFFMSGDPVAGKERRFFSDSPGGTSLLH